MPPFGREPPLYEHTIALSIRWSFSPMTTVVAAPTCCGNIFWRMVSPITLSNKMFRCALERACLLHCNAMNNGKGGGLANPHGLVAITAKALLLHKSDCTGEVKRFRHDRTRWFRENPLAYIQATREPRSIRQRGTTPHTYRSAAAAFYNGRSRQCLGAYEATCPSC